MHGVRTPSGLAACHAAQLTSDGSNRRENFTKYFEALTAPVEIRMAVLPTIISRDVLQFAIAASIPSERDWHLALGVGQERVVPAALNQWQGPPVSGRSRISSVITDRVRCLRWPQP
jgi:hypothetical protein